MKIGDELALNFDKIRGKVTESLLSEFYGPPDTGHYSNGVQETLFKMGSAVVDRVNEVEKITLSLPNIHFLPCNLAVFQKNKLHFEDDVYVPTDEPHGIISATIARPLPSKL